MRLGQFVIMFTVMIMFLEFIGIPTGASVALSNFGIDINPNTGEILSADGDDSTFYNWIFGNSGILILITGGVIIVGLFAKGYDTSLVILPLIVLIGTALSSTCWIIIKYMSSFNQAWATNITLIILGGLWVAFIMSCVDYFGNR